MVKLESNLQKATDVAIAHTATDSQADSRPPAPGLSGTAKNKDSLLALVYVFN